MKIEIKSRFDASVLFAAEIADGIEVKFQMRAALEVAVKAGANLADANLAHANLAHAALAGAYLADAALVGANLAHAALAGAYLVGANLAHANLAHANLAHAALVGANLAHAALAHANLADAALADANLADADFDIKPATPEETIANLDKVRAIILDNDKLLHMDHWHADSQWRARTCAEEAVCGTTHCLAGWLQVCSTNEDIRRLEPNIAGVLCAPVAAKMFYASNDKVLKWLDTREYAE